MISLDYLREIFKRQECHYESVAKPPIVIARSDSDEAIPSEIASPLRGSQ